MMTRKHFTEIANVLAGDLATAKISERHKVRCITLSLADVCAKSNPNFDRSKFYIAAGLDSEGFLK